MVVKGLITLTAIVTIVFLLTISNALIKPIWDNVNKKKIKDVEGMVLGYAGFAASLIIFYIWFYYIFS